MMRGSLVAVRLALCLIVPLAFMGGCTRHIQKQYFAVKDPDTGATSYYRLSIKGQGTIVRYNMQAGYFSTTAVDVLRGQMPNIPTLDLPIERIDAMDRLLEHMDAGLLQEAKRIYPVTDPESLLSMVEKRIVKLQAAVGNYLADHDRLSTQIAVLDEALKDKTLTGLEEDVKTKQQNLKARKKEKDELTRGDDESDEDWNRRNTDSDEAIANAGMELAEADKSLRDFKDNTARKNVLVRQQETLKEDHPKNERLLAILEERRKTLIERHADRIVGLDEKSPGDSQLDFDETYIRLARLVWLQSLSKQDVASIGETGDMNPYQFRKLVFWSTAATVDLNQIAGSIDAVTDQVHQIAENYKQIRKQRLDAKKKAEEQAKEKEGSGTDPADPSANP